MIKALRSNYGLLLLVLLFIATRFLCLVQLYHQDEYRWVSQVYTTEFGEVDSPHPPIMQSTLSLVGKMFGYDNLRVVPFVFGILNLLLIYAVSLKITGNRKIAYLSSGLYVISIYGLIANLMIDIDGAVMPFFVLLSYYFYIRTTKDNEKKFILPLTAAIIAGLLTKLSFLIFVGALAVEYLWTLYDKGKFKHEIKRAGLILGILGVFIAGLYLLYGENDPRF